MAIIREELTATISPVGTLSASIRGTGQLNATLKSAVSVYENDYELLKNQPKINDVTLVGNKSLEDLDVHTMGALDIIEVFNSVWNN